jgi:predicted ATP-binding protein involved in virulence
MPQRSRPAVYFTSLAVKNVRAFKDHQHLDLTGQDGRPARWTLIVGENGVGKTTLLECLVRLRPVENTREEGSSETNTASALFIEPIVASADNSVIFGLGRSGGIDFEMRAGFLQGARLDGGRRTGPPFETKVTFSRRGGKVDDEDLTVSEHDVNAFEEPLILAYGAGRHMGVGNLDLSTAPDPTASLFDANIQLFDAEELIQQLDYAALKGTKRAKRQRDRLLEMIAALLPDVEQASHVVIYGPKPVGASGKSGVHIRTPYGEVPFSALSFGYQTVAAWVTDIAWRLFERYPRSTNPLIEPAVVLVDEIDLHLHPRWQRQIRERLTEHFPNVQFIVTAHSPLMAQIYLDANLVVVKRDGDHSVIENDPAVVQSWRLDEIITSELFGLESAWPPPIEELFAEQRALVAKRRRTPDEDARLRELDQKLHDLPIEDNPQDQNAMDIGCP